MLTFSANLNELGNPTIWGANYSTQTSYTDPVQVDLYKSKIIVEKFTTGISILITPVSTTIVDKTNTDDANSSLYTSILSTTGLVAIYDNALKGFTLIGNILSTQSNTNSDLVELLNSFANFQFRDNLNSNIETQELDITINQAVFLVAPEPCSNCIRLAYIDSAADYVNPLDNWGKANRGQVEYQYQDITGSWISMGSAKLEGQYWLSYAGDFGYNPALISFCDCGMFDNTPLRAIRTVRAIPNCGGTSPIIYQSISNHFNIENLGLSNYPQTLDQTLYSTIPYIPSATFDGSFACCVSKDSEIEVIPISLTPNRNTPHNTGAKNALKYDLYINNQGVYKEVIIIKTKSGQLLVTKGSNIVTGTSSISLPVPPLFLSELVVGATIYTETGIPIGIIASIESDSSLTLVSPALDDYSGGIKSNQFYFVNPTNGSVFNFPSILPKTGTIVTLTSSDIITGTSTNFTSLNVQDKVYTDAGILIGRISSITSDTQIRLYGNALVAYSGIFKTQSAVTSKGTYKLVATYNNACTNVSKEWIISICNSTIINTGTCNNPSIQNLSAINSAKFTIKTSNSLDIVDSVTQKVILKDQIVSPLSTYQVTKLDDGFYQLDVQTLDEDGVVLSTESQLLFYDCNIKSCEVYLRSNLLGFSNCVDCVDKKANQKEYETLKLKNDMFQIYKDIIYSYWNNIKKQQSIDETWDIEDHLQEVTTYSNALKQIKTICTDCGFSFNTNTGTLSSGDCGCGK